MEKISNVPMQLLQLPKRMAKTEFKISFLFQWENCSFWLLCKLILIYEMNFRKNLGQKIAFSSFYSFEKHSNPLNNYEEIEKNFSGFEVLAFKLCHTEQIIWGRGSGKIQNYFSNFCCRILLCARGKVQEPKQFL